MTPIETLIVRAYKEAVSRVVNESYLTYSADNVNQGLDIQSSGVYSGTLPRKFQLDITDVNKILVTELQSFSVPDAPYTITVLSGVAFDITGTGISVVASYDSDGALTVGDRFLVRMNKCSTTMREVVAWEKSRGALAAPGSIVYAPTIEMDLNRLQGYSNDLKILIEFLTNLRSKDSEGMAEDIGCILNELNRDLTQGDLCWKSNVTRVQKFDTDASDVIGAQIYCTAYFRHVTADVSVRF